MAERGDRESSNLSSAQLVVGIGDRLPPPGGEDLTKRLGKMQLNTGAAAAGGENETLIKSIGPNLKEKQCGKTDDSDEAVCAVCGQPYSHPVELPCNHIFCYLCVKGVLARKPSCPFCRASVPRDFALKPKVVEPILVETAVTSKTDDKPQWYYEGRRGGWWLYDPRTIEEIESAYKDKKTKCIVQVAGFNYAIDFEKMVQYREDRPERRRKILRNDKVDSTTIVKGVAGLYSQK